MTETWTRWYDQRPTDHIIPYRWRVSPRTILNLEMQPEWTDKLHSCGMGYGPSEYWPVFSDWDGWRRTVDKTLEWRVAEEDETEKDILWRGLDLLPSPFTGQLPHITFLGRWICAPPYIPEWISIQSKFVNIVGIRDAARFMEEWNRRA